MAITQTYCDYGTGNDYKGASFTDGAYTSATKTLVKAGAFAATKVNHWLYLESNDGGSIVAGYYRVATVPDANTVTLATDAGAGVDDDAAKCTQHDGTTTKPWRSVQGALDLITRDTTNGDQVNVKAGTAQVLAESLNLTTYGTPTEGEPLIFRGYTSAANDGGRGHLSNPAGAVINSSTLDWIVFADMTLEGGGNPTKLVTLDDNNLFYNVIFLANKGGDAVAYLAALGDYCQLIACQISGEFAGGITGVLGLVVIGCYSTSPTGIGGGTSGCVFSGNILVSTANAANDMISFGGDSNVVMNNILYATSASTKNAINLGNSDGRQGSVCMNNVICGFSGAGGKGIISAAGSDQHVVGHNAFYNNTTAYALGGDLYIDLTANDVTLAADPFTDAANGDFSLTAAGKTALRGLGWPGTYLGAHANTDGHVTIGAVQYGEAEGGSGGGGPVIGSRIIRGLGAI